MKKILGAIIILAIIVGGYWYFVKKPEVIQTGTSNSKLNMDVVCQSALAYMTFPNGAAAEVFLTECKEGKHPEVVERYKADMNLGDGAAI